MVVAVAGALSVGLGHTVPLRVALSATALGSPVLMAVGCQGPGRAFCGGRHPHNGRCRGRLRPRVEDALVAHQVPCLLLGTAAHEEVLFCASSVFSLLLLYGLLDDPIFRMLWHASDQVRRRRLFGGGSAR